MYYTIFFSAPTVKGNDGTASEELIQYGPLDAPSKKKFPAELLLIIRRQAVDLLLGDRDNQKGRDALRFIKDVATGRDDVKDIRKGNYFVRAAWLGHCSGSNFV